MNIYAIIGIGSLLFAVALIVFNISFSNKQRDRKSVV